MTAEEVGAYVRLLCHQWSAGFIPDDDRMLRRIAGEMAEPSALSVAKAKFKPGPDGNLRNERLEKVRSEREAFLTERSKSGAKGAVSRWGKRMAEPMAEPSISQWQNDGLPSPSPSPSTEIERQGAVRVKNQRRPEVVEECVTIGSFVGVSEADARQWYADCEVAGWKRGDGTPFDNWPRQLVLHRDYLAQFRAKQKAKSSANGHKPDFAQRRDLEDAIACHVCNRESRAFDKSQCSKEKWNEFVILTQKLETLKTV